MVRQIHIKLPPFERGFHLITGKLIEQLGDLPETGVLHIFIQHTSAGLTINENADRTVLMDFESSFNRLIPEGIGKYVHSFEGTDDMPAHLKSSIIGHAITIPISNGQLNLGTWQGIYLCEFRNRGGSRKLIASIVD